VEEDLAICRHGGQRRGSDEAQAEQPDGLVPPVRGQIGDDQR
jgi:hypothetical protein